MADQSTHPYFIEDDCIWMDRGRGRVQLSNFVAQITEQIRIQDDTEPRRFLIIQGRLRGGQELPPIQVPVEEFAAMAWPLLRWDFGPHILPGRGFKDHVRHAIEQLSGSSVPVRTVFNHTGWLRSNNRFVYLHADGAVGKDGPVPGYQVDLPLGLQPYSLPKPLSNNQMQQAVRTAFQFAHLGSRESILPIWAAIWRAPLCDCLPCTTVLWVHGESGSRKTTTALLALAHYGGPWRSAPASWTDTDNAIERKAHAAKDTLFLVDDFTPEVNASLSMGLETRVSRILRDVGNQTGRGRLGRDLQVKQEYPPRGLILSTAERLPPGTTSLLARMLPVPFGQESVSLQRLSELQERTKDLAIAGFAYVQWLAGRAEEGYMDKLAERFLSLRNQTCISGHPRLAEAVANLMIGAECATDFAVSIGAVTPAEAAKLRDDTYETLLKLAQAHGQSLLEESPAQLFVTILQDGLASGSIFLNDSKTGRALMANTQSRRRIGWADDRYAYLIPSATYQYFVTALRQQGGAPISKTTLLRLLVSAEIVLTGSEQGRLTIQKACENHQRRVLCVPLHKLLTPP